MNFLKGNAVHQILREKLNSIQKNGFNAVTAEFRILLRAVFQLYNL